METPRADNEYMTVQEARRYLRLGQRAFYERAVHDPTLLRMRVGRRVVFRKTDLDAWAVRQLAAAGGK